ncbi:MAG: hypothetical protein ACLP1D_19820 [Xanthobacteraceae bacterium]
MFRTGISLAAALILAGTLTVSAQTPEPAPAPAPKASKLKLTVERLKEMRQKWSTNHARLVVCRKEVKAKGLVGDDRWFYIEDCMGKT